MKKLVLSTLLLLFAHFVLVANPPRFYGQKIVGYVPSYGDGSHVDYKNLTHAIYAFLWQNSDGSIQQIEPWEMSKFTMFLDSTAAYGTKRMVALSDMSNVANNAQSLHVFADTLVKFCKKFDLQGVDVDWEGISTSSGRADYTTLMDTLEVQLHKAGLDLSATIGYGDYWLQWYEDKALKKADWIQIMIYDMTGTWTTSPFGNHSSFQHFLDAETYWIDRGFTRDKLVMGVPFYGRKFSNSSGGLAPGVSYKSIVAEYPHLPDTANVTPGTDYNFFNGPALIRQKSQYLIDHNFAGIMIWEMTQDAVGDKSLHGHVACVYNNTICKIDLVSGVNDELKSDDVNVFVYQNQLHIQAKTGSKAAFELINVAGKKLFESSILDFQTNEIIVPLSGNLQGLMLCRVHIGDQVITKRILISQ